MVKALLKLITATVRLISPSTENPPLYELARSGELDELAGKIFGMKLKIGEDLYMLYKWSLLAKDFGHAGPEYFPELDFDSPETYASAHFDVGRWYLLGEEGVPKDSERAFQHFETAARQYDMPRIVDNREELEFIRQALRGDSLERFNGLFPQLQSVDESGKAVE